MKNRKLKCIRLKLKWGEAMQEKDPAAADLLTVKAFAHAVGISPAAAYSRLAGGLRPYLRTVRGRKYLHADALKLYGIQDIQEIQDKIQEIQGQIQEIQGDARPGIQEIQEIQCADIQEIQGIQGDSDGEPGTNSAGNAESAALRAELDALRAQLDGITADLRTATAERDAARAIAEAERRRADALESRAEADAATVRALTEALQGAQQTSTALAAALQTAQALHAGTIQLEMQPGALDGEPLDSQSAGRKSQRAGTRAALREFFRRKKKEPPQE